MDTIGVRLQIFRFTGYNIDFSKVNESDCFCCCPKHDLPSHCFLKPLFFLYKQLFMVNKQPFICIHVYAYMRTNMNKFNYKWSSHVSLTIFMIFYAIKKYIFPKAIFNVLQMSLNKLLNTQVKLTKKSLIKNLLCSNE